MEHLHTCPLHRRLMPSTSLSHILHNEETRDNTFDCIFHSKLFRLFDLKFVPLDYDLSCPRMHRYYHSLSLCHCREQKPTFQIINNW